MIQFGTAITSPADELQKMTVERLFQAISKPKQNFMDRIHQLRTLAGVNQEQYKELKKQLPYFVCGIFHPPIRRKTHFAAIHYFIIDLDHLEAACIHTPTLRQNLQQDETILLLFESPSGDGLKIMFRLEAPCTDEALFSAFYKLFVARFATRYQLQSVADFRTSDVTRACFISYDPEAYYQAEALPVAIGSLIEDLQFHKVEKELKALDQVQKLALTDKENGQSPSENKEILDRIKARLNPRKPVANHNTPTIPPQIHMALDYIKENLAAYGMDLLKTTPIHYGHQLKIGTGDMWSEINLFYGQKKGYTIVKTTKTGSSSELADLAAQALYELIHQLENTRNGPTP